RQALTRFSRLAKHATNPTETIICQALCNIHRSPQRTREVGDAAIAMLAQHSAHEQQAHLHIALSQVVGDRGHFGEAIDHARAAAELGRRHQLAGLEFWTAWLAILLATADRYEEAHTVLSRLDTSSNTRHRVYIETADLCLAVGWGDWSQAQTMSQSVV